MIKAEIIAIKEDDILTFDVLEWWHEGYEFGRPCLMLSPVIRENSDSHPEAMIEDVLIDMVISKVIQCNNQQQQIAWRQWNLSYLRKVFNQALKGKKFPIAQYKATRQKVRIIKNKFGELTWREIK